MYTVPSTIQLLRGYVTGPLSLNNKNLTPSGTRDNIFTGFILSVACTLFALSQISAGVVKGGSLAPSALLFFLAIYVLFRSRPAFKLLDRHTKWLLAVLLFVILAALPHFVVEGRGALLDTPSRFLLSAVILLAFAHMPIQPKLFFISVIIAGIAVGLVAAYQVWWLAYERASGSTNNAIVFGYISTSILFSTLLAAAYFRQHPIWRWLALASVVLAGLASIMSVARGAWIALPLTSILLIHLIRPKRWHAAVLYALLFVGALLAYSLTPLISDRIDLAVSETINYMDGSNALTSIGLRFEMWQAAWLGFLESPLIGLGFAERAAFYQQLAEQNIIWSEVMTSDGSDSAHNELLMSLVLGGLLGLVSTIALYAVPLHHFYRHYKTAATKEIKLLAIAGLLVVTNFIVFGLTEVPLHMDDTALYYGMTLVFIWICLTKARQEESVTHGHD